MDQMQEMNADENVRMLLSYLMIIVHRNGGEMTIENLSEFGGKNFNFGADLDAENDRVILRSTEATTTQ